MTKRILIFDVPTRLFHWSFAVTFIATFIIANSFDDEDASFSYHMILGIILVFMVMLRIIWGIVGTEYAKFSSYVLSPSKLFEYLKNIFSSESKRVVGRNPASSWAALSMMLISIALGITGYIMTNVAESDFIEEAHELLANAFLIIAILHIAGIVLHTIRHKDPIGLSMIHGRKLPAEEDVNQHTGINNSRRDIGVIYLILVISFAFMLMKSYSPQDNSLTIFNMKMQLSELEEEHHNDHYTHEDDDDDDDD